MKNEPTLVTIFKIVMSWKTTVFGLMAAIGAAVVAAIMTDVIDVSGLPKWVKGVAGLMSVIGTAGLGFFARDNDKTSEQVGNSNNGAPGAGGKNLLAVLGLAGLGLAYALVVFVVAGCSSARLESGGDYAPLSVTNNAGQVLTNPAPDLAFYNVDALYQFSWHGINAAFDFEYANRAFLFGQLPEIKRGLDKIRPAAVKANADYLKARAAYVQNPTPAGLDALGELEARLAQLSVVAGALMPITNNPSK